MKFARDHPLIFLGLAILSASVICFAAIVFGPYLAFVVIARSASTPTPTAVIHASPPTATKDLFLPLTQTAAIHDGRPSCYSWDQITEEMNGTKVCVRGIVRHLVSTASTRTRYTFSDEPNTFFLFTNYMDVYDPRTGKTIKPGACLEVSATIHGQSGVPYMNLDELASGGRFEDFSFYDDPSACK